MRLSVISRSLSVGLGLMVALCSLSVAQAPKTAQIAFTSNRRGSARIFTMNTDGSDVRPLTKSPEVQAAPRWSPDGRAIAFIGNDDPLGASSSELYVMDADGSNARQLTQGAAIAGRPSWTPDGRRILFTSDRNGEFARELFIIDQDGRNERSLYRNGWAHTPTWMPGTDDILFSGQAEDLVFGIHTLDTTTGATTCLTVGLDAHHGTLYGEPAWSPVRQQIATETDYGMARKGFDSDLYLFDPQSRNLTPLVVGDGRISGPEWEPNGERIAFSISLPDDHPDHKERSDIRVVHVGTRVVVNLTGHRSLNGSPSWFDPIALSVMPKNVMPAAWGWLKSFTQHKERR